MYWDGKETCQNIKCCWPAEVRIKKSDFSLHFETYYVGNIVLMTWSEVLTHSKPVSLALTAPKADLQIKIWVEVVYLAGDSKKWAKGEIKRGLLW